MNDFGWPGAPNSSYKTNSGQRNAHGSLDVWSGGLAHPAAKLLSGVMIETRRGGEGVSRRKSMRSSRKHFRPILRDADAQASFKGARASSHRLWATGCSVDIGVTYWSDIHPRSTSSAAAIIYQGESGQVMSSRPHTLARHWLNTRPPTPC